MKQVLTTGKIPRTDLAGDGAILKAMKTNEYDTVSAYERASSHKDAIPRSRASSRKRCRRTATPEVDAANL